MGGSVENQPQDWGWRVPTGRRNYLMEIKMDWQPIETAPKDGTIVLACWAGYKGCILVRMLQDGEWHSGPNDPHIKSITHWMPLPAPPVSDARLGLDAGAA